jgi:hypothetical protein
VGNRTTIRDDRYAEGFALNHVDEREAVALTDDKLRIGGIANRAHREKILAIIDALLAQYDSTEAGGVADSSGDASSSSQTQPRAQNAAPPSAPESAEETEARRVELEKQLRHYAIFQQRLAKVFAGDTDKQRAARVSFVVYE